VTLSVGNMAYTVRRLHPCSIHMSPLQSYNRRLFEYAVDLIPEIKDVFTSKVNEKDGIFSEQALIVSLRCSGSLC
jgi:hypothetical protein